MSETKSIIDDVMKIRGIRGAAVIAQSGDVAATNIAAKELNGFFELLYRVASEGKSASSLGQVRRMVVRTDKDEDLALVMKDNQALAIVAERSRPQAELFAEVGELLGRV